MASILPPARTQFFDRNGNPLSGCLVYFYVPNTTTLKNTYQDEALTVLNTNPVVLDARGEAAIWGNGQYRVVLMDPYNTVIYDALTDALVNSTEGVTQTSLAQWAADTAADVIIVNQGTAHAADRTLNNKLQDTPSILDYNSDAVGDDSTRLTKAVSDGVKSLYIPSRKSFVIGDVTIPYGMTIFGDGAQDIDGNDLRGKFIKPTGASACINLDGSTTRVMSPKFEGIQFFGANESDTGNFINSLSVSYLNIDNCSFNNLSGYALSLADTMESTVFVNTFRRLGSDSTGVIQLLPFVTATANNVNNLRILGNTFGYNSGNWINMSSTAYADLIMIMFNKFEWDGTPVSANASARNIINLGNSARTTVAFNGFTNFRSTNNNYGTVISNTTGARTGNTIMKNEFQGCDQEFSIVSGGFEISKNDNVLFSGVSAGPVSACTSSLQCDIQLPVRRTSNFNIVAGPVLLPRAILRSGLMSGVTNLSSVADADSDFLNCLTVSGANAEIRRVQLAKYLISTDSLVRIYARFKATTADAVVKLNMNGTTDIQSQTVAVADGWKVLGFDILPGVVGAGSCRFILVSGGPVLCDSAIADFSREIVWSFAWTPGAISNGGSIASPTQPLSTDIAPGLTVVGVSAPWFDGVTNGVIPSTQVVAGQNFTINLYNPTGSSVTPAFTRAYVKIQLR